MNGKMLFACFLAVISVVAKAQDNSGCPGGVSEGQDSISGAYYYTCKGGQLTPAGCMSDTQQKIPIGSTYNAGNIVKTCVLNGDTLTVKCTACVTDDGQVVQPGQNVDSTSVYYTCVPNSDSFDLQVAGCLSGGNRVAVGATTTSNDQTLLCQKTSNRDATFVAAGCVLNGQSYDIGAEVQDDKAFYHCAKTDSTTTLKPVGCIVNGQKVYDLDLFVSDNDSVYRCRVDDSGVRSELFGCNVHLPDGTTEKKSVACTWDVGAPADPFNIVKCCIKDKNGGNFAKETDLYCLYTYMGGRIQVDEGCYRVFGDTAAGCARQSDGSLQIQTFPASNPSGAFASMLHQC